MNVPILISEESFQIVWARAIAALAENGWELWNLVVQIKSPNLFEQEIHSQLENYAKHHDLILPNQVAYTIFPYKAYHEGITREKLYKIYWKYFEISQKSKHHRWGAYFERMIRYPNGAHDNTDQLGNIIDNINSREKNHGSAHVIVIPIPKRDANKTMGAPCLNYITVQTENQPDCQRKRINLLAVYRNHDFSERAYGNYFGLCKLLNYIACETDSDIGSLTCISSHAFAGKHRNDLLGLARYVEENADE